MVKRELGDVASVKVSSSKTIKIAGVRRTSAI